MKYSKNKIDLDRDFEYFKKIVHFKKYKYVIIGSGPASYILCKFLKKKIQNQCLVIERGNFQDLKSTKIFSKNIKINSNSRVFKVGGASNVWGNIYSKFQPHELKCKKKNKNIWPLKFKELNECYNNINNLIKFDLSKIGSTKKYSFKNFNLRSFAAPIKTFNCLNFFKKNNNFTILYNSNVTFIDEDSKHNIVKVENKKKNGLQIFCDKIILCNGGLESIRLILKSLKNKKIRNLKNKNYVGKFFMDHPKGYVGIIKYPKNDFLKNLELKYHKNYLAYNGVSLSLEEQRKNFFLNTYVRFEKKISSNFKILNFFSNKNNYFLKLFCEMEPRKSNNVKLDRSNNLVIKLALSKKDIFTANYLLKKIFKMFSSNYKNEKIINVKSKNLVDASHHMGGLTYPYVVNKNLKFNGLNKVYCCTSAIFPTSGSANPTLTICALAYRLAKHLNKI